MVAHSWSASLIGNEQEGLVPGLIDLAFVLAKVEQSIRSAYLVFAKSFAPAPVQKTQKILKPETIPKIGDTYTPCLLPLSIIIWEARFAVSKESLKVACLWLRGGRRLQNSYNTIVQIPVSAPPPSLEVCVAFSLQRVADQSLDRTWVYLYRDISEYCVHFR
jgi:hypothetical protein